MPDTVLTPEQPVTMETADGFLVIASRIATGSVVPPYKHDYWHEYAADLQTAHEHFAAIERGEYRDWRAEHIVACTRGVPLGAKVIL